MTGPARIVLVEDDPTVRSVVDILLATEPSLELVGWAASAQEGIELVRSVQPDLLLLDNQLAGPLTGLAAAPAFKAAAPRMRVLLCTALDLARVAAEAPEVDGFLRKDRLAELPEVAAALLHR